MYSCRDTLHPYHQQATRAVNTKATMEVSSMYAVDQIPNDHVGLCHYCGRELPVHPGRGRHAYCPPPRECAHEARREQVREAVRRFADRLPPDLKKARENAYKFIHRQGLSRRELLTGTAAVLLASRLETWPASRTARKEEAANALQKLRGALVAGDREFVADGALALQSLLDGDESAFASHVKTFCEQLLRDAGQTIEFSAGIGGLERAFKLMENRALTIEKSWATQGDHLNLVWALLTRGSLYRQYGRERDALQLLKGAENILTGLCQDRNRKSVNLLLHQTLSWRFRLNAFDLRELDDAQADLVRLHHLTEEIGSPITRILTARDEAAYWQLWGELARSENLLKEAGPRFRSLDIYSAIAELSLRRPAIELSLLRNKEEATEQVREYRRLWRSNPTMYQLKQLRALEAKCGLKPSSPTNYETVYLTPILAEVWMDERFTAL
jgi:hypothetical protein